MTRPALTALLAAGLAALPAASAAAPGAVDPTVPAARDTDPVVLTGRDLMAGSGTWAAPENLTAAVPGKDLTCYAASGSSTCPDQYNHYQEPDLDTAGAQSRLPIEGTPNGRIVGYRWARGRFRQIPFQVDEVFTRYLNNDASGFGVYSGTDRHTTYAFDREGFRFTENSGPYGCTAAMKAGDGPAADPVKGLDSNDELAFMAADAGSRAPARAKLPRGIEGVKVVTIVDPTNPDARPRYVYIARAGAEGPDPAFTAANGYVHYQRDANADTLVFSQSTYDGYGPAKSGEYCTPDGQPVYNADGTRAIGPRREIDGATISTDRYRYRYDGRWLMTAIEISSDGGRTYGPDLVDRWKARAFAQDPGSKTPCCGYEEEDTNWGGSSSLLGERVGPVRAIRETWGADSGTNVVRRETFYRRRMVQKTWLRVHVIPPLDGIYAQWDFNAGRMTRFFNAANPAGVAIDGRNDEVYGNFDDPCNPRWDRPNGQSLIDGIYRDSYKGSGVCSTPVAGVEHASIDPGDATFADANAALGWSQTSGPAGTIVDRIHAQLADQTPAGLAQSIAAVPYYRDDACFDDGTGSDPGPEKFPRQFAREQASTASDGTPRRCWNANADAGQPGGDPAVPAGDDHFWQGSIGTHGMHLLFLAESDNARLTVPTTEIVSDWDMVMLPTRLDGSGQPANVGERYGRPLEKPLVAIVADGPRDRGSARRARR